MKGDILKNKVIAVVGPTASGKSDFAVELALKCNGEIISADSRQIYKGLDIGSGKITKEEMKGVPHHMLDIKNPEESFSVVEYVEIVLPLIEEIQSRGKTPILCGGTGQYVYAVLNTVSFPQVPANETFRKELESKTTEELFAMLQEKDSTRANTIDRHNKVRLIRALEILEKLDEVPELPAAQPRFPYHVIIMQPSREHMRERILLRLDKRLHEGMIEEVQTLLDEGVSPEWLEDLGLEYRYITRYLQGELSLEKMREELYSKTCQYAKRQVTWNKKHFPDAEIVEVFS